MDRPEEAVIPAPALDLLISLAANKLILTTLVSGRSLKDVKSLLGPIEGLFLAGNHGLEIEGPGVNYLNEGAASTAPLIKDAGERIERALAGTKGILVENKKLTLSLHYRLMDPSQRRRVHETFYDIVHEYVDSGELMVRPGKMVLEVRPKLEWDKGRAVSYMLNLFAGDSVASPYPVYVGDDVTDEDAFAVLSDTGITVLVSESPGNTAARYFVKDVKEVQEFLEFVESAFPE